MKTNQKGFAHFGLLLLFFILLVAIGGAFFYVKNTQSNSVQKVDGTKEGCNETNGLVICVTSSKSTLTSSENTEIKTTITNKNSSGVSQTFSCTATDPSVVLNDKDLDFGMMCGQAITQKSIPAKSSESFSYAISGSKMKTGDNTIKSIWGEYTSGTITVQKLEQTNDETASQFKSCQNLADYIELGDVPKYCATIIVMLQDSSGAEYTCNDWKNILKKVDLLIPCIRIMDTGVGLVYVPRNESEKYIKIIESLPQVKSAFLDDM